jgi:hypothetical protein
VSNNPTELKHRSRQELAASANVYVEVVYSGGTYTPAEPFKGLFCIAAGDAEITGVDGVSVVLPLTEGVYPLGGIAIVEAGTSADLVALF